MARLKKEDIVDIRERLSRYDAELVRKTGLSLKEIASRSIVGGEKKTLDTIASRRVAVIPVTVGQGVIGGFVEAVAGILAYLGADVFRTEDSDVAGLAEGVERGADIVFLADDNQFIALNLSARKVVYNVKATAKGYVAALEAMAGGLDKRSVLVIGGAGRVGWNAVLSLKEKGAKVGAFDLDRDRMGLLAREHHEIALEANLEEALSRYTVFFDASPSADNIRARHVKPETLIAAPASPLMLDGEAYAMVKERLIHDSLEIGVAAMLFNACCFS